MPLFRPYEPKDRTEATGTDGRRVTRATAKSRGSDPRDAVVDTGDAAADSSVAASSTATVVAPVESGTSTDSDGRSHEKNRPTRSRREAEAERRARVRPNLSKKEARRKVAQERRATRMQAMAERDNTPEKKLIRDFFDSRWNLMEFLLPALLVMLASTLLASAIPMASTITLIGMYGFLVLSVIDFYLAWRRFKVLLASRYPRSTPKGLLFYGVNRALQIRRMRLPAPEVKRGDKI